MSQTNMAQPSAEQPLLQLTLNKWFSYRDNAFIPFNRMPDKQKGLFSIAFAGNFNVGYIDTIVNFLAEHNQNVTAVCQYQPDLGLAPALCFYIEKSVQSINPLILQTFSTALDFQLVQIVSPPNL
jgi:phosphoserine phosphatase